MRICYLCADLGIPLAGSKGGSAHVRGLVRALGELGHEVVVVSPSALNGGNAESIAAPVIQIHVPEIAGAVSEMADRHLARALGHLWNNVGVEKALLEALKDHQPELIYERYSPFGVAGVLLARRMGIPHVLEVNAPLAWEGTQYRHQALAEAADGIERLILASTTLIVAVSAELRDMLIANGVEAAKVLVVPNGVDVQLFAPAGPSRRNGLGDKVVIGFVGSLKPWHGIELLADAFRRLGSDPRYHLLVVGHGPLAKVVEALSAELPGRVTLAGAVAHGEVPPYLRAMDIAVAPYPLLERFYFSPLKVLEYMAAGRAVVASRIGQLQDLVRSGQTGLLVEPGDPQALAEAIQRLASDEALRRALGEAAATEARRAHRWTDRAALIVDRVEVMR